LVDPLRPRAGHARPVRACRRPVVGKFREFRADLLEIESNTETVTKPSSKPNETLLQQPAKNAAIWFSKANVKTAESATNDGASFAEHYDASRAEQFCEKYRVLPSKSPYIIVTTERPNLKDSLGDYYKMSLGGADAETTLHLLQSLADQIVSEDLDQEHLDSETYWRKWEQIGRDFLSNSGNMLNRISISIDTHFFKIELNPTH
jgi:hypothetical protein